MKNPSFLLSYVSLLSLFILSPTFGQRCLTDHLRQARFAENPALVEQAAEIEAFTQKWIAEHNDINHRDGNAEVTLPVIVHVLWRLNEENISDEQIQSQIAVLNEDFRKLNDNLSNTPGAFLGLAADIEMEFCLATIDPNGIPTTGITRTQTSTDDIGNSLDYFDEYYGGVAAWDIEKYINIWVCDIGDDGTLGFATPPGTADPPESDGLVIAPQFFGTTGTAAGSQPNHLGRTVTHEMGHYFNLEHLWGPGEGGCGEDDMVADTPLQQTESGGCPNFPLTDNCTSTGDGIMFMNYMDYADDDCMTLFSEGQKARMLAALNGPRSSLLDGQICEPITALSEKEKEAFRVYPNPANHGFSVEAENAKPGWVKIELCNLSGQVMAKWVLDGSLKTVLSLEGIQSGIYFLKISDQESFAQHKMAILKN